MTREADDYKGDNPATRAYFFHPGMSGLDSQVGCTRSGDLLGGLFTLYIHHR
jgi:hypothetical protein